MFCLSAATSLEQKRTVRNVFVENPPEDPCNLFVRPEVRYLSDGPLDAKMGCRETYAPGDALLERMDSMWIVKVASAPRIWMLAF